MDKNKFDRFSEATNKAFDGWKATFNLKPSKKLLKSITGLSPKKNIKHMFLLILEE